MGLNLGAGIEPQQRQAADPMAANPNYTAPAKFPSTPRGSGIQTVGRFQGRGRRFESQVDFQAAYALRMNGQRRVTFLADIFNLFNTKQVRNYDQNTELAGEHG